MICFAAIAPKTHRGKGWETEENGARGRGHPQPSAAFPGKFGLPMADDSASVRADKWLWAARFFKTRSLASQAIDLGRVRIAGERIKPARTVKVGERMEIHAGEQTLLVIVRALSAQRGPASAARTLYEETPDSIARRERIRAQNASDPARSLKGRPTKRDRRRIGEVLGE